MSIKKAQFKSLQAEKERFKQIMSLVVQRLNQKRQQRVERIIEECPDVECARESLEAFEEVNRSVDKYLDKMSHELHQCVQKEKINDPTRIITCFSRFEYLLRYETKRMEIE